MYLDMANLQITPGFINLAIYHSNTNYKTLPGNTPTRAITDL